MKTTHLLSTLLCILFCIGLTEGTVIFDSGTHTIDYTINDYVTISGVNTKVSLVSGGWVKGIRVEYDGASFTMTGGFIESHLAALSSSPVMITGGLIGERLSLDSFDSGDVTLYGSDFMINGQSVPYGTYHVSGHISGTLANSDLLDVEFNCSGANDLILAPVPEPATLSLLAIGGLLLRRKV